MRIGIAACFVVTLTSAVAFSQQKTSTESHGKPPHVVGIHYSLSSGMCYGYCYYELNVEPGSAVLLTSATDQDKQKCPDLRVTADLSGAHWKELADVVNREALLALPDRIGCPGCMDEVIESLEVRFSDHTKKGTYYNVGSAPQVEALSNKLLALKEKLAKELPPIELRRCNPK